ncbi:hypothetical protein F441_02109, partial [Phytophthora nicotianae CJ01A1]
MAASAREKALLDTMAGSISEEALRNLRASPMREENGVAVGAVSRLALEREAPDDRQATGR